MAAHKSAFHRLLCLSMPSLVVLICGCSAFVQELDDSFADLKKEGSWLVEFYAPWCGYCKKLEPIWIEVGRTLHGSAIKVAKLDATRFSIGFISVGKDFLGKLLGLDEGKLHVGIARDFGIRGYPSIKFVRGKRIITFEGERTVQDIVQFAERANRPAVTELHNTEQVERVRKEKNVCFFLVTSNENSQLSEKIKNIYSDVAESRVIQSYFYHIDLQVLPKDVQVKAPTILVSKDDSFFSFQMSEDVSEQNVSDWVNNERFEGFVHVTKSNFHDIAETGKVMMLAILAEKKKKKKLNERVSEVVKNVAINEREKFHRFFQFGWMLGDSIASNIMMSSLPAPYLMAYNTTDQVYYLKQYSEIKDEFTEEQLVSFLEDVLEGRAKGYGGDSYFQRLYRGIWDLIKTIYEIWTTQPIAALVMFGFPLLVFSFVIYMLCIADPGPEEELDEEDDAVEFDDGDHEQTKEPKESDEEAESGAKPKTE